MKLNIYQIDTFTHQLFAGNPAAVVPLKAWLDPALMQKIANENHLSETAFFVPEDEDYRIRWFTPLSEVDLCGHATLASAFVLFDILGYARDEITFISKSGDLKVRKEQDILVMDFPAKAPTPCAIPDAIGKAFGITPLACYSGMDYLVVFENETIIKNMKPDMRMLETIETRAVIVTAKSDTCDFVCRVFAPKVGIDEDPATGSAFTQLIPYWHGVLGKDTLHAKQLSQRGGEIFCRHKNERVEIGGHAVKYLEGNITI